MADSAAASISLEVDGQIAHMRVGFYYPQFRQLKNRPCLVALV